MLNSNKCTENDKNYRKKFAKLFFFVDLRSESVVKAGDLTKRSPCAVHYKHNNEK
jgi:hypothetical protein